MATSTSTSEFDKSFPYFEENNFTGWLVQFKAHLRQYDADEVLDTPIPKDVDANGAPIPMTARERADFVRDLNSYKEKDRIAYSHIMKACRLNPKTKNLTETGGFQTGNEILTRLRQRFYSVDELQKAAHLLRYSSLRQQETESGADFVDREQQEYLALRDMGIQVDDSLRLTKFIQQDCTNSKHKSLAQTIFTTPNMTLTRATSLFETYQPPSASSSSTAPTVNALFCRYCKKEGHNIQSCNKKKHKNQREKGKRPPQKNSHSSGSAKKKQRYPCAICDSTDHLSYQCPRKAEVKQCLKSSGEKNLRWGKDEHFTDEEN
jgi:hypothetical protein